MKRQEISEDKNPVLLDVCNLKTYFRTEEGILKAVDGISFRLRKGKSLCIVGESGSGKSVALCPSCGLFPPPGKIVDGQFLSKAKTSPKRARRKWRPSGAGTYR
jgi:ABC-type dipeptide/oligopeptide/nickel transport system ATPase component